MKKFGELPASCRGAVIDSIACHAGGLGSIPLGVTSL